jgi:hypothetical protein
MEKHERGREERTERIESKGSMEPECLRPPQLLSLKGGLGQGRFCWLVRPHRAGEARPLN